MFAVFITFKMQPQVDPPDIIDAKPLIVDALMDQYRRYIRVLNLNNPYGL